MIGTNEQHQAIHLYSLVLFSFFLPLLPRLAVWLLAFGLLNWLLSGKWLAKFRGITRAPALMLIGLFVLYLLSLSYSEDLPQGRRALETRLSLLVFPLLLFGRPLEKAFDYQKIWTSFLAGASLAVGISLGMAAFHFLVYGENLFFYKDLGSFLQFHPTYFAMYVGWALFLWVRHFFPPSRSSQLHKVLFYGLLLLLILFLFLLSARMELLVIGAISMIALWMYWIRSGRWKQGVVITLTALVLGTGLIWSFPVTRKRFQRAYEGLLQTEQLEANPNIRWTIWPAAVDLIQQHPLTGVGLGDVQAQLVETYERRDVLTEKTAPLNAHNQFLQTGLAIGLPGILLWISFWALTFYTGIRSRQTDLLLFATLFFLSTFTESMLATQRGILFFGFFACLLWPPRPET